MDDSSDVEETQPYVEEESRSPSPEPEPIQHSGIRLTTLSPSPITLCWDDGE